MHAAKPKVCPTLSRPVFFFYLPDPCFFFLSCLKQAGAGDTLADEKCITILRKMSKQQQESIDMYRKGKREDLVEKETKTQQLIDAMLPQVRTDRGAVQRFSFYFFVFIFLCTRLRLGAAQLALTVLLCLRNDGRRGGLLVPFGCCGECLL